MTIRIRGVHLGTLIVALTGLIFAPLASADDKDDIMALVSQYGDLEDDLAKQSDLIRDDRVMITNIRQTNNAKNMEIQMATRKANDTVAGGKTRWITTIESPRIAVYGDTAVASFVRTFTILPHNQAPINGAPNWVTLVLVKEDGDWGIAHTHMSPAGGN
jgi:ketosteroid isomerase-like protein